MDTDKNNNHNFYEEVEDIILQRKTCDISFWAVNDAISRVRDKITKLYIKDGKEYIVLNSGLEIGIDRIIDIEGVSPQDYC